MPLYGLSGYFTTLIAHTVSSLYPSKSSCIMILLNHTYSNTKNTLTHSLKHSLSQTHTRSPSTSSCARLSTLSCKTHQTNSNSFRPSGNLLGTSSKSGKAMPGRSPRGHPFHRPALPPSPYHHLLLLFPALRFRRLMSELKLLIRWLVCLHSLIH